MNPENNNVENGLESQSFGQFNPVDTSSANPEYAQPVQEMATPSSNTFTPFQNLNNESLNVPTENTFNPTPVDPSTFNAEVNNNFNTVSEPAQPVLDQPQVVEPVITNSVDSLGINEPNMPQPDYSQPVTPNANLYGQNPVNYNQGSVEPSYNFNPEPVSSVNSVDSLDVQPQVDTLGSNPTDLVQQTPAPVGPTIPIPDSMPTTDYQATVSTPLDYATPMSDFDQIGTTPELDPKSKSKNKNNKKSLVFCLLIIIIAGLGAGAYYLINVKGLFNSSSVVTKELKVNSGSSLPTDINEYATFKNTSASNCVLNTDKVDITKAGTYKYTITCGDDSYEGNVVVIDKTAPNVELNLAYTTVQTPILKESIVKSVDEENATYEFTNEEAANEAFASAGFKTVSITAKDASGNSVEVTAPVVVLDSDMHFGIIGIKNTDNENVKEKVQLFLTGDIVCKVGFKSYVITFASEEEYNDAVKTYTGGSEFTYGDYKGIPVFYKSKNTIVIITEQTLSFVDTNCVNVLTDLQELGYTTFTVRQTDDDKSALNFDFLNI